MGFFYTFMMVGLDIMMGTCSRRLEYNDGVFGIRNTLMTVCFWFHRDSGPLIICTFLSFVHVSALWCFET